MVEVESPGRLAVLAKNVISFNKQPCINGAMSGISQKEYLKKYLGIGRGSGDKKKKKKHKKLSNGLKIVDDDVDVRLDQEIQVDLTADNEDAPQIVSVIDDRPPSLRIDEVTHNKLWQPIGAPDVSISNTGLKFEGNLQIPRKSTHSVRIKHEKSDDSPPRKRKLNNADREIKTEKSEGVLPSRIPNRNESPDYSPPRRIKREKSPDNSPPRKLRSNDLDNSPPRIIKREKSEDISPVRKIKSTESRDNSPPRRIRRERNPDSSPPKKWSNESREIKNEDISSSRRHKTQHSSPPRRIKREKSPRRYTRANDSDNSPHKNIKKDISHPRRTTRNQSTDNSPPRRSNRDNSPPRRARGQDVVSIPPRRQKKSRWANTDDPEEKTKRTIDGKKAGLQNATELVQEMQQFRQREDELFKSMRDEVSGANAATVVRGKTKEINWEEEEARRKKEEENKEKYNKWGRGLKQVEDVNEKIKNELYEMSKPLARYADDEDLEKYLKEQERDGDPMLAYLRKKKKKKAVEEGKPFKQQYEGDAPPNRFAIRPGYRWDGVDRSNGYEKQWFQVQNTRQANIEESYKWSTEDM